MIDIHSHVLPEIDDGAASLEDALAMLAAARDSGTAEIVATPHCGPLFAYEPGRIALAFAQLSSRAEAGPRLHRGCELHLSFETIDRLLAGPSRYTINGSNYVLAECAPFPGVHTGNALSRILDAGLVPILAHPERNPTLRRDIALIERWVGLGCLVQLTAASITGLFGRSSKAAALRLLERGLAHVVASDAHDPLYRHARLDAAFAAVRSRFGEDAADLLFESNPAAIVAGRPLPGGIQPFARPPRRWWSFWSPSHSVTI